MAMKAWCRVLAAAAIVAAAAAGTPPGTGGTMCCGAYIAACLACARGLTVQQYCAAATGAAFADCAKHVATQRVDPGVGLVTTSCGSSCWAKSTCNADGGTTPYKGGCVRLCFRGSVCPKSAPFFSAARWAASGCRSYATCSSKLCYSEKSCRAWRAKPPRAIGCPKDGRHCCPRYALGRVTNEAEWCACSRETVCSSGGSGGGGWSLAAVHQDPCSLL